MGWFFTHKRRQDLIDELLGTYTGTECIVEVKAHFMGMDGIWALRVKTQGGKVSKFITLDLIDRHEGLWGHKPMDETVGPCFYDCPLEYLDEVPDPGGFATNWRKSVRARHKAIAEIYSGVSV